jgi:hypothetical protein
MHPPRHALAALLMEQGHDGEAEQVYRDDLGLSGQIQRCAQHPDNVWALHGLVECLQRRDERVALPALLLRSPWPMCRLRRHACAGRRSTHRAIVAASRNRPLPSIRASRALN